MAISHNKEFSAALSEEAPVPFSHVEDPAKYVETIRKNAWRKK